MGLSGAQKTAITSSWKTLSADSKTMENNGCTLFALLFQKFPDTQRYFRRLSGFTDDAMKSSAAGRAHAMTVFKGLDNMVSCLDDQKTLDDLATKLCKFHLDHRVGPARFQEMREVFGTFLDKALEGRASADVKSAWDAFLAWLQDFLTAEEKKC